MHPLGISRCHDPRTTIRLTCDTALERKDTSLTNTVSRAYVGVCGRKQEPVDFGVDEILRNLWRYQLQH